MDKAQAKEELIASLEKASEELAYALGKAKIYDVHMFIDETASARQAVDDMLYRLCSYDKNGQRLFAGDTVRHPYDGSLMTVISIDMYDGTILCDDDFVYDSDILVRVAE